MLFRISYLEISDVNICDGLSISISMGNLNLNR